MLTVSMGRQFVDQSYKPSMALNSIFVLMCR